MYNEGMSFADALKLAQELGYAEKDPTADVEGHDACRKICIISSLVFGKHVYPSSVYTKGISQIELCDVAAADVLGYSIKLIASVRRTDSGKILPAVMPMLVPYESIMSGVSDVFNAVLVYGDGIDQAMFYGRGAGKLPTASAVMGDVIETVKHRDTETAQSWESSYDTSFIDSIDNLSANWYFRLPAGSDSPEGSYEHENGISYVTEEKLTFKAASAKAAELGALAFMPVLD